MKGKTNAASGQIKHVFEAEILTVLPRKRALCSRSLPRQRLFWIQKSRRLKENGGILRIMTKENKNAKI